MGRKPIPRPGFLETCDYLGMTRAEYEVWLCDPFALPEMLQARRSGRTLSDVMQARYAECVPPIARRTLRSCMPLATG